MDPELDAFIPFLPKTDLSDPVAARKRVAELAAAAPSEVAAAPSPGTEGMEIEDRTVAAGVPVRIYRPRRAHGAIIWLRGGGWILGDLDTEHPTAARIAGASGAVVISVDYRRAPEHRFPAALDDVYAVPTWAAAHTEDPGRIAVGGHTPLPGSRPPWRCGRGTSRARRSGSSCSTSPCWTTGRRRGRSATSPTRPGRTATRSPRCGGTTWAAHPPRRTPLRPAPPPCPARPRPMSPPRSSTRCATRTSATRCASYRRGLGRAAPVARDVPRLAGDPVRRRVAAADRRTRRRPPPRPGRVRWPGRGQGRLSVVVQCGEDGPEPSVEWAVEFQDRDVLPGVQRVGVDEFQQGVVHVRAECGHSPRAEPVPFPP